LKKEIEQTYMHFGPGDVELIRKYHSNKNKMHSYGSLLKGPWLMFWFPPKDSHGVCMAINLARKHQIIKQEIIVLGCIQYITLEWDKQAVGISPNTLAGREDLLEAILDLLAPNIPHWCIGEDLNMIENPYDRIGGRGDTIKGRELSA
jgi:hypothetical protein